MTAPTWGDIGDDQHEIEFEPFRTPAIPEPAPAEPERVPVGVPA